MASDHRPAAMGAARASTPSAINTAPAIRFLKTPEGCNIGYPLAGMIIVYQESCLWKEEIDVALLKTVGCRHAHRPPGRVIE
jgi:hypothetical protein